MNYNTYTFEDYNKLNKEYTCLINLKGEILGYVDCTIHMSKYISKIVVNNEVYIVYKANSTLKDEKKRNYRKIIAEKFNEDIFDESTKKVYFNKETNNYYYSYKPTNDTYICNFLELQWKSIKTLREEKAKDISHPVLTKNLQVYCYSVCTNAIYLNTIKNIEDNKIYVYEYDNIYYTINNVFLKGDMAEKHKSELENKTLEYYIKDNNWVRSLRLSLENYIKMSRAEKDSVVEILKLIEDKNINLEGLLHE